MTQRAATLIGLGAVVLWSLLAVLTAGTGRVPPFQLAAMTFVIGGAAGVLSWVVRPGATKALRQPPAVLALGAGGLFAYHALYFAALRLAPPAEAGLVNYLWPLLVVLFSAFLPNERLRVAHVVGAVIGFAGLLVLFNGRAGQAFQPAHVIGYLCAAASAFVWAGYSLAFRRLGAVPTDTVALFCLATAALSLLCHVVFETTVWPQTTAEWSALAALGAGPVGAAFYLWDIGVKRGDIHLLGVGSYAAPVLSTCALVVAGYAEASLALALACTLIVAGALAASVVPSLLRAYMLRRRASTESPPCSN